MAKTRERYSYPFEFLQMYCYLAESMCGWYWVEWEDRWIRITREHIQQYVGEFYRIPNFKYRVCDARFHNNDRMLKGFLERCTPKDKSVRYERHTWRNRITFALRMTKRIHEIEEKFRAMMKVVDETESAKRTTSATQRRRIMHGIQQRLRRKNGKPQI